MSCTIAAETIKRFKRTLASWALICLGTFSSASASCRPPAAVRWLRLLLVEHQASSKLCAACPGQADGMHWWPAAAAHQFGHVDSC